MAILNSVLSWLMKKRMHQIELFLMYPVDVQNEWLRRLMLSAKETEWGLRYDYVSITKASQFKERVPVSTYEELKPFIDRVRRGEQNVLWPQDIKWFAKSSGTTGDKSKYIPVSEDSVEECHFKGGKDLLTLFCTLYPETRIFDGKGLMLGGSHSAGEFGNEVYYGDLSAILMQNMPFWAQYMRTPDLGVALMDEWEEKIDLMAELTIKENVTNISGVPSWTIILLQRILEITGKSNILEVWPGLEVYFHGGVSLTPYREQFHRLIPGNSVAYLETYNASEGFFGIQDRIGADDMLLMLDYGVFYEFMPLDQLGNRFPKTLGLDEVELHTNYALIISTNGGLWRYLIGDTLQFTSLDPFRIRITGRTKNFINVYGEELMIDNADMALDIACKKTNASIKEYTAAPVNIAEMGQAAHQWAIEFADAPQNIDYFTEVFDNALKAQNSDYEAKRYKNMILQEPVITCVPAGSFYNWMKRKGKLGGQNKVPRLYNDRRYIDDLLETVKNKTP